MAAQQTFTTGVSATPPATDVIISQPKATWDAAHAVTASLSVHSVGESVQSLGQTFSVRQACTLQALTLQLAEVRSDEVSRNTYAVSLFTYADADGFKPSSLIWSITGKLPEGLYGQFKSDPESRYLTFTLPETKLDAGTVYGLVLYATVNAGKNNWKQLVSFTNSWGSFYTGGRLVTGNSAVPDDVGETVWKGTANDLTFWIQAR